MFLLIIISWPRMWGRPKTLLV